MQPFADAKAAKSSDSTGNSNQYILTEYPLLHSILCRSNRQFSSRAFEQLSSLGLGTPAMPIAPATVAIELLVILPTISRPRRRRADCDSRGPQRCRRYRRCPRCRRSQTGPGYSRRNGNLGYAVFFVHCRTDCGQSFCIGR
jgi:hypothetical protein